MDNYFDSYREMVSLRGLSNHTLKSYSTYIRAYLDYLTRLGINPSNASWDDMRSFVKQFQADRNLADRTVNCAISQLRFLTIYVLHRPWDDSQLPLRRFDEFLPYVPSREEVRVLIDSMPDLKTKAKALLGHKSLNSTTIYVHLAKSTLSKAVSPFDRLGGGTLD